MNEETNDFLRENLEEAHATFNSILLEMKEKNVVANYYELIDKEEKCYQETFEIVNKMNYFVTKASSLQEEKNELLEAEYGIYIKYFSLYIVSLLFIRAYHEIFDTKDLSDILKYIVGMFLGSAYMILLNKDIHDNRSNTKEKRDLINELKTLKEQYKEAHDKAVCEIDGIFAFNDTLWDKLDKEKVKKK